MTYTVFGGTLSLNQSLRCRPCKSSWGYRRVLWAPISGLLQAQPPNVFMLLICKTNNVWDGPAFIDTRCLNHSTIWQPVKKTGAKKWPNFIPPPKLGQNCPLCCHILSVVHVWETLFLCTLCSVYTTLCNKSMKETSFKSCCTVWDNSRHYWLS